MPPADLLAVEAPVVGVRLGWRSVVVMATASALGLFLIAWPLVLPPGLVGADAATAAPALFALLMPAVVALVLTQLTEGGLDSRSLAMLGVLTALNAVLRPTLGAGTAGIESVFFLLILAGRAYGPGFGFMLGVTSLFASALLTAGVGPWLPFQMLVAGWVGLGAGLLPRRVTGRAEIAQLMLYGVVSAYLFGALMNLWGWPFITATALPEGRAALDYIPGAPLTENLVRFGWYTLVTSTATWDTGRAITTALALLILGRPLLVVLRRASGMARLPEQPHA